MKNFKTLTGHLTYITKNKPNYRDLIYEFPSEDDGKTLINVVNEMTKVANDNNFSVLNIQLQYRKFKFKDVVKYYEKEYIFQRYADNNSKKAYVVGEVERICVPVHLLSLA